MLQEENIKDIVSEQVWREGCRLYEKGNVQNMQISDTSAEKNVQMDQVTASVVGSSGKIFQLTIKIDATDRKKIQYQCGCNFSKEKDAGICKHCVAALLRYLHVKKIILERIENPVEKISINIKSSIGDAEKIENNNQKNTIFAEKPREIVQRPKHITDSGMYHILLKNGMKKKNYYLEKGIRRKVKVEPFLQREYDTLLLTIKIGITQMYVISNISEFCEMIHSEKYKVYGKKLAFTHQMSAFTDESKELVKYLIRQVRNHMERDGYTYNNYNFYGRDSYKKNIPLTGNVLDEFIQVFFESSFLASLSYGEEPTFYHVEDREPLSKLRIEGVSDGIILRTVRYQLFQGASYQYIFRAGTVYRISLDTIQNINEFRNYMNKNGKDGVFISIIDLPLFCRDMLPYLQEHYKIEEINFDSSEYLPEPVNFEIYLDLETKNQITCQLFAVYGEIKYNVFQGEAIQEQRNVERETEASNLIKDFFPRINLAKKYVYEDFEEDELYDFLLEGIDQITPIGDIFVSDAIKKMQVLKEPKFQVGVSISGNLLELSIQSDALSQDEIKEILSKYNRKKKYYRLKNGSFLKMEQEEVGKVVSVLDAMQITGSKLQNGKITLPKYRALYLEAFSDEDGISEFTRSRDFRSLIRNMKSVEESEYEVPNSLKKIAREYQKNGFRWLETLHHNGFGGILADDMGLGKTLQMISFLVAESTKKKNSNRKTLIVCPASLVYNWKSEIEKFAPTLSTRLIVGNVDNRVEMIRNCGNKDILITSYDLLKRDILEYEKMEFFCEIIDEAQFIKNQSTQAAKAVKDIQAETKFALTGTPIENRISELWSIFDYLMPGFLFHYQKFREEFEIPIMENKEEAALQRLHKFISPFVLRRLKKDVLKDLPDKMEEVVFAQLEGEQKKLYHAHVEKMRQAINKKTEKEVKESNIQILAELTKLRQICCTPALVYQNYKEESAKVTMCIDLIRDAVDGGHKILIFSQFTSMLSVLAEETKKLEIPHYVLTGATTKEHRMIMVDAFQENDVQVFFISLKAGGTGLNLTSADIVIHFDPWWNIAAQNQATDRTHRIGQKNVVTVYQLIAKNTIEEKIIQMQREKKEIAEQVLGGENLANTMLSKDELLRLLKDEIE